MKRMTLPKFGSIAFVLVLVAATAANVAFHTLGGSRSPIVVSSFGVGTQFPAIHLAAAPLVNGVTGPALPEKGCRLVVAFSSTCPHCHAAAMRERELAAMPGGKLPVIWVADSVDRGIMSMRRDLGPNGLLSTSPDAWKQLKINAVPAAFLIGDDDRVKSVWVYQGNENESELRALCTGS